MDSVPTTPRRSGTPWTAGTDILPTERTLKLLGTSTHSAARGDGSRPTLCTCRRTRTRMGTKSLTITEEAYERLRAHKREGESFTDTILRLTDRNRDVMKGFGLMNDVDGFREAVASTRSEVDDDLRTREERCSRPTPRSCSITSTEIPRRDPSSRTTATNHSMRRPSFSSSSTASARGLGVHHRSIRSGRRSTGSIRSR